MRHSQIATLAVATLLSLPILSSHVQAQDFLYVGDLKTGSLLRYSAILNNGSLSFSPFGLNGNTSDPAYITNAGVTEGVHGTGTTLITSQQIGANNFRLSRFSRATGAFINFVTSQQFAGIGNLAVTNDAQYAYVPDESGNRLYRVNIATGATNSVAMSGVHDVQIGPDGYVYATAYSKNSGVVRFSADLSSSSLIVAPGADGLTRPAGVVVSGNTLYVAQNKTSPTSQVHKYTLNGDAPATHVAQATSDLLSFSFGMEMGQDSNLYIAVPGSYLNPINANQIVKMNLSGTFGPATTSSVAILYPGTVNGNTYEPGDDQANVIWPKYIKFSSNFAQANDPGFVIPEVGSIALLLTGGLPLLGVVVARRRKLGKV